MLVRRRPVAAGFDPVRMKLVAVGRMWHLPGSPPCRRAPPAPRGMKSRGDGERWQQARQQAQQRAGACTSRVAPDPGSVLLEVDDG